MPWWIVFLIGTALIVFKIASLELIALGIFLDFILVDADSGFFGLFYTLYFFALVVTVALFNSLHTHHEA
ncbi:MAG: hypothetical protein WDZ74_01680 [Candidatus Paceibacterota bacterium]